MIRILAAVIPIFMVIFLGWFASLRGLMRSEFLAPTNRLVFYISIPAMIFRSIAQTPLRSTIDPGIVAVVVAAVFGIYGIAWAAAALSKMASRRQATFIPCSGHGNLGYLGLAVAFYYLGTEGLAHAGIIATVIILLQNPLTVIVLQLSAGSSTASPDSTSVWRQIISNPVILAAMAGMGISLLELPIPMILDRFLEIIGSFGLPLALLIIGASLDFNKIRRCLWPVLTASIFKLVGLPAIGLLLFRVFGYGSADFLPAMVLLSSPTATVVYVLSREMNADENMAVAGISASTLLSAVTYTVWLHAVS